MGRDLFRWAPLRCQSTNRPRSRSNLRLRCPAGLAVPPEVEKARFSQQKRATTAHRSFAALASLRMSVIDPSGVLVIKDAHHLGQASHACSCQPARLPRPKLKIHARRGQIHARQRPLSGVLPEGQVLDAFEPARRGPADVRRSPGLTFKVAEALEFAQWPGC